VQSKAINFAIERQRHRGFVGRDALLAQLDELLVEEPADRWVVVTGGPGMGKSALLSAWLTRREVAGELVPHHFIRRKWANWDDPASLVGSLTAQIEARFPDVPEPEADADLSPAARLAGREVTTLRGHAGSVRACVVTPDGRRVVSASEDQTLKTWDLQTGHEVATLDGHADRVGACAVTPDGRRVVSGSDDKTLKVWDLATGHEIATLKGHAHWVLVCAVTPDGRRVVSGSRDKTLKVWDFKRGCA
jgi:WD40 repeat protein